MPDMFQQNQEYIPRIVDKQVEQYLQVFGAVEISGPKWCGKTWTACHHGKSVSYVDEALDLAQSDPYAMLEGEKPHVIDEWQLAPRIWNVVRHVVDQKRGLRGGWLLTGSSTPIDKSSPEVSSLHSGAGRIGRIRMWPMTLAESGGSTAEISLAALFEGRFDRARVSSNVNSIAALSCKGGWPETIDLDAAQAQTIAREYLNLLFAESIPKHGKNGEMARKVALSIVRNLGQATTYKTMVGDIFAEYEESASIPTLVSYLDLMKDFFFLVEIPGWVPERRSPKRLSVKPKRYLADPSLAVALLGMDQQALIDDWQTFGLVFENLCIRDLSVYAQAMENSGMVPVRYYRDDSGLEADAIIELADGRWAAFEFKLSSTKIGQGIESLKRIRKKLTSNPKAQTKPPAFMAVIVGIGEYAYQAENGIYVIPINALGA